MSAVCEHVSTCESMLSVVSKRFFSDEHCRLDCCWPVSTSTHQHRPDEKKGGKGGGHDKVGNRECGRNNARELKNKERQASGRQIANWLPAGDHHGRCRGRAFLHPSLTALFDSLSP
jgi:hypothetical protein